MTHTKDKSSVRKQFALKESLNTSNYEKEDKPFDHNEKDVGSSVRDRPIYVSKPIYILKPTTAQALIRKYVDEGDDDDETRSSCITSRHRHRKILKKSQQHRKITDDPLLLRSRKDADEIENRQFFFYDDCEKNYARARSLHIHNRSHTGEIPHVPTIKDNGTRTRSTYYGESSREDCSNEA